MRSGHNSYLVPVYAHDDPPYSFLSLPLLPTPSRPHLSPRLLTPPPKLQLAPSNSKVDPLARHQTLRPLLLRPFPPTRPLQQPQQAPHAPQLVHRLARQDELVLCLGRDVEPVPRAGEEAELDALALEEVLERGEELGRDVDLAREGVGRGERLAGVVLVGRGGGGGGRAVRGEVLAVGEEQVGEGDQGEDCGRSNEGQRCTGCRMRRGPEHTLSVVVLEVNPGERWRVDRGVSRAGLNLVQ